jgi:non-ribosomal peptide synthetase component F
VDGFPHVSPIALARLAKASVQRHGATVLGVVPSGLDAMQPAELPTVRWIFTWGEVLPAALGQKWRQNARVVELLISNSDGPD